MDFYNSESDFLERFLEQTEYETDYEELIVSLYEQIVSLYEQINSFHENPFHKFYSEENENYYFLLSYNTPEDFYFKDVSEEFRKKLLKL